MSHICLRLRTCDFIFFHLSADFEKTIDSLRSAANCEVTRKNLVVFSRPTRRHFA